MMGWYIPFTCARMPSGQPARPVELGTPSDVSHRFGIGALQVNTQTLPVWAIEAMQRAGVHAAGDEFSVVKSVTTGFGDDSIVYISKRITCLSWPKMHIRSKNVSDYLILW